MNVLVAYGESHTEKKGGAQMGDLISRQELIKKLNQLDWQELYLPVHFMEFVIDEVPTIQINQQTSTCIDSEGFERCPNCGAKMEKHL